MRYPRLLPALLSCLFLVPSLPLQAVINQLPATTVEEAQPKSYKEHVHWARRMSLDVRVTQNLNPISKQVVLVPDAATFLDELSRWSTKARWPILYDDDMYAPMFIRAYEPLAVFRRSSIGSLPNDHEQRRALIDRAIANSWRMEHGFGTTAKEVFDERSFHPLGAVFTSLKDPAWPAAAVLAAARGQYLFYLEGDLGKPGDVLSGPRTKALMDQIDAMLKSTGTPYTTVGDRLNFLTICRSMSARTDIDIGGELPDHLPREILNGPKAITDVLGRHADGTRFAFTGWILGGQRSSLYAAMCSFFLNRTSVWLGDSYEHESNPTAYAMAQTEAMFKYDGYTTTLHENLDLTTFQDAVATGLDADQIYLNSGGNADFFDLGTSRASPYEVPILDRPAFLYLIHSWSMKRPDDPESIGGRWLRNGAYAVYGSSHEPLLSGFRPAYEVARRIVSNIPLGPSVRMWEGEAPLAVAWRINLFGDPMMLSGGPSKSKRSQTGINGHGAENLVEATQKALELALENPGDEQFAKAIKLMVLTNLDGLAMDLWHRAVKDKGAGPASAKAALGSLFRRGDRDGFMLAWTMLAKPTSRDRDMLWSLMGPTLGPDTDAETARIMSAAIRPRYPAGDLHRLAPVLARTEGDRQVVVRINQLEATAVNRREKKGLEQLRTIYSGR